jgi:hypothetical protein
VRSRVEREFTNVEHIPGAIPRRQADRRSRFGGFDSGNEYYAGTSLTAIGPRGMFALVAP